MKKSTTKASAPRKQSAKSIERAAMKVEKTLTADTASEIIALDNIRKMSERIALRALKTVALKSGGAAKLEAYTTDGKSNMPDNGGMSFGMPYRLYCNLIGDLINAGNVKHITSDGYDIVSEVLVFLYDYIGQKLSDISKLTDRKGAAISILRAAFKIANKYIMSQRKSEYNKLYLDDPATLALVAVPFEWDAPTYEDWSFVDNFIKWAKLPPKQLQALKCRLCGYSVHVASKHMGIAASTVRVHLKAVAVKYIAYTQTPEYAAHIPQITK